MENCVFSLCTCTLGTQEFDALAAYGVVVSSPFANKLGSSFVMRRRKDCGINTQAPLTLVIGFELDASPSV
jgi:hypothetical protein